MSSVQHPNIIHIYEVFENKEKMVLVMEYAAGGELYDYLSERKVLNEDEARRIFRQIATACYYCHKHKICHRDLKLENILLDVNNNAKIADFGLSNVFDDQRLLSTFCGSPLYASPEIVKGTPYNGPEVDCWSLGVLLYTLVYGAMPFDGSNFKRLVKQISQGDYFEPAKPSPASPLIRDMLTVNPKSRANIEKICTHWWVNETYDENCLEISEELANQTPVRLDLLLSLAPPPPQLESEKLLVTEDAAEEIKTDTAVPPTRSQSVGSVMELAHPAERRIKDMMLNEEKTPKRKLENTVSTDRMRDGLKKKDKIIKENTIADITLHGTIQENASMEDASMTENLPLDKSMTQTIVPAMEVEPIDPSLEGAACAEILEEAETKKPSKIKKNLSTIQLLEGINEIPSQENINKENIEEIAQETKGAKKKVTKKKVLAEKNEEPSEEPPNKPIERRRSRIFEVAEKFQNMISPTEIKPVPVEKPKKIVIPGVSVDGFKKEFERKASLTSTSPPKIKATPSKKVLIDQPKVEETPQPDQEKVKNAVSIISSALDKEGTRKSKSRPCCVRKPPVPFGASGRSASGNIGMLASTPKPFVRFEAKRVEDEPAPPVEENQTSSAEITLKSATLPRRKTTKAEIQLNYPVPKPATMEFKTEMAHNVTVPIKSAEPKERIIPISFDAEVQSPPTKPPVSRIFQSQKSNQSQRSLSRQSTQDSDTETTSGEPIRKSPREYIIPIAVEGGGYVTPRSGSVEPSESTTSTMTNKSRSKFGRARRMNSLFSDRDSEDESGHTTLNRHSSFGKESDTEDSRKDAFHRLRSTRPKRANFEHTDSLSSGEEDDDDGFEIWTAEHLFSNLLSRVRNLTQKLNVEDGGRHGFPNSRLLSHFDHGTNFWNFHNRLDPLSRHSSLGRSTSRDRNPTDRTSSTPWRRSASRDLASDIESVFKDTPTTPTTRPRGGGELIDAYNQGGQPEVEKLMREQFGQLMYQEGKGQTINRSEYLRWKFRDHEQVILPIEASLSRYDPLGKWNDHEACWQMQYRGSLGESLLHVLIICDTKIHTRLARTLLKVFPKLALDVVEGEEYLGASALHLAIAYNNNEMVQDLVEAGANVNQRAEGSFFLPRDQQREKPLKHTDYEGLAYLGEYPLAWAACCANESVYNLLLDTGADPDYQDNFGNMILHMVVVCDKLDMFGYALRHPKLPASNGIVNKAGLTPLTLACKLGRAEVFREMLELSAKEFWRYSNITCSAYFLNALDTLLPDGRTNWNSALFIILNGTKEEHLDMLDGGIIQRLLEEKWKTFARNQFLKRLLILVGHLLFLSLAVYLRPDDPDEPLLGWTDDFTRIARYCCEVGTILGVLSYVILQQGDEMRNQGVRAFLKQQLNSPPKLIFLISNFLILACIPCRLYGDRETEEAILGFAVPGSWFLLMFFAGAVRLTGPFVTMIYSMITGDMLTFGIIYTIVLFGFSQSFYFLYKGFPGVKTSLYNTYATTWMALFQITLGNYDYQELGLTTYPSVSKTVFAIFMVFVPILLLNMLIAMMGNTYAHVIEQSEKEWVKQWAKIVIALERAIPQADAHHYLQEYSISLGPSEDPSTENRGVLVIKSKSKTRAKQRKGAVTNWKRVGKVTINALKKRGLTGEEMRCLMWGRESINTPIKLKGPVKDPLKDPLGPNLTGGFGDALTTALDVMAFTHDLDIVGASQGLNLANNPKAVPTNQIKVPPVAAVGGGAMLLGAITQLADSQVPPIQVPITSDPFRELVIHSSMGGDPEKLKFLALSAANLDSSEVVKQQQSTSVKSLAGIFAGTEGFVRKMENTIKKKYAALDPSDSEGFAEPPLLGKLSRSRRAKSANLRNLSAKSKATDKKKIISESSSVESTETNDKNEESSELDFAEERMKLVTESMKNNMDVNKIRPINIDVALGQEPVRSVALSETLKVQGSGEGAEVQSVNSKPKRRKRSKTANNKIAPGVERPCRSANDQFGSHDSDSPDPLEPWSTKKIANMNKILAWENDQDSL